MSYFKVTLSLIGVLIHIFIKHIDFYLIISRQNTYVAILRNVMHWNPISDPPKTYSLDHINPFTFAYQHKGNTINIDVKFGFHTFTDKKENGISIKYRKEERYFSPDRYSLSFYLKNIIQKELVISYIFPFRSNKGGEQFYNITISDVAIFFTLRKKEHTQNTLNLMIVSAYEVDEWGKGSFPKGKALKWDYLVFKRLNGQRIL